MLADIDSGILPQVSFYKPVGRLNQHPAHRPDERRRPCTIAGAPEEKTL
jgi:hypothetical protein